MPRRVRLAAGVIICALLACLLPAGRGAAQERDPAYTPQFAVGGPIIDFTARDSAGNAVPFATLTGEPILLKFFRGHWCPHCISELRSWEKLDADFTRLGVRRVGISTDTPEESARMQRRYGFHMLLLSDPDLHVTRRYGLLDPATDGRTPIPTSILVAADGTILWVDVAEDYTRRTDAREVYAAVRDALRGAKVPAVP